MDVFETLRNGLAETGRFAAEKAKLAKDIIVVKDQIRNKKKEIKTLTYKIGLTYMELHPDDYEEAFADFIRGIKEAKEEMAAKKSELDSLRAQIKPEASDDYDILDDDQFADIEFEDLADDDIKEVTAAPEADVEEAVEAAPEVDVEEIVEEIAEEVEKPAEISIEEE